MSIYRFLFIFRSRSSPPPLSSSSSTNTTTTPPTKAGSLIHLPFGLYAKLGGEGTIQEALTTIFVSSSTTIPVPTILDIIPSPYPFFLMTGPPGTPLESMPQALTTLTPTQLTVFSSTLQSWLIQLQSLQSPYNRQICGYLGGAFKSPRIASSLPPPPSSSDPSSSVEPPSDCESFTGPYESQFQFHSDPSSSCSHIQSPLISSLASIIRQKSYSISFIHGNISPSTILVDRDYKPVGLVAWGCAAWMPEYWQLTSAVWSERRRKVECYEIWEQVMIRALPMYPDELKVEKEIWDGIDGGSIN